MTWFFVVAFAVVAVSITLGWAIGDDRGFKRAEAMWEEEWEKRRQPLTPSPWANHGVTPSVLRVAHRPEPPAVVEPVRTEVMPAYRARHSSDGEFTQEIKRMTAAYYSQAAAHMRAVAR